MDPGVSSEETPLRRRLSGLLALITLVYHERSPPIAASNTAIPAATAIAQASNPRSSLVNFYRSFSST
ncbi:hypothetical protein GCG54_00015399 [Colletotrichum gloeosporioides]|uniref:Uncharacterized protein n=1 Tax=Colletotrichum gloeosporioides TaxID=474922 RepID=A0A8H4CKY9_COLGL|nr:uncharacterized protein GCG54_00015399 [Colletotrichum gloeosporioides]KAF3805840.1 hypothetical protein GCG54_00015399 [Colletotrichum gloeosporioides]